MVPNPPQPTNWPEASVPAMNAADPAPRTQPYSKPGLACDDPRLRVSASGVSGANTAACVTLTASSNGKFRTAA